VAPCPRRDDPPEDMAARLVPAAVARPRTRFPPLALIVLAVALLAGCAQPAASTLSAETAAAPSLVPLEATAATIPSPEAPTLTPTQVPPTPDPSPTANTSGRVHLAAVGDLMLGRTIGKRILNQGAQVPFAGVASVLRMADITVGNLECAMGSGGTVQRKYYTFLAPPEAAQALAHGGLDILNLANNHALDHGTATLAETLQLLSANGMRAVGAGLTQSEAYGPLLVEVNGLRIAFLGRVNIPVELTEFDTRSWAAVGNTPGVAWGEPSEVRSAVRAAKAQADVVVLLLHSGWEMVMAPPSEERVLAQAAIDAGASLVLGTHSHLIQPIDTTRPGTLIAYGLGNFVFDEFDGGATDSAILHVELTRAGVESFSWQPVEIQSGFPVLVTPTP